MPAAVQPGQTRHLRDQHEADLAQSDRGDQALEARAHVAAGTGQAEILVNDLDPRRWPAPLLPPFGKLVLPTRALLVDQHLPRGRLPDVDECAQAEVAGLDFGRGGVHGTAPLARRFAPASPRAAAAAARSTAGPRSAAPRAGGRPRAARGMGWGSIAWRASGTGAGASRKVATRPASARRLPGLNIGDGTAADGPAHVGCVWRAGRSCRSPSGLSITTWGSPLCRLRRTTPTDWPNNGMVPHRDPHALDLARMRGLSLVAGWSPAGRTDCP